MVNKVPLEKLLIEQKERIGTEHAGGLPLLGVNNKDGLHRSTRKKVNDLSNYKIVQRHWFAYNPMRINVGSLGLALTDEQTGVTSPDYVVFSCGENLSPHYLYRFLKSPTGMIEIRKNTTGTVRERLYFKSLAKIEIPLPSISEQIDISNKINGIENILGQIIDKNSEQLDTVDKLRQAILQLAVQGKLVPQYPKDESASVLLEKIKAEKERLIKDKTIRPLKKLHQKAAEIPPFELPKNWEWVRFHEVIWCFRGHNPPKSEFISSPEEGFVRFIQITDFKTDSKAVYVPDSPKLKRVYKGEIIMAAYRHIGKLSREMEGAFNVALCKVNEIKPMIRDYVEKIIGTDLVKGELLRASGRGHIPSMHSDHLLSLFIPIPPLEEQHRIVAKIDELMALCDELETRLSQSQTDCDRLMEASIAEILAA